MATGRCSQRQRRLRRWLAADEPRTRGMRTSRPPELVAAVPSAPGNRSPSLRR